MRTQADLTNQIRSGAGSVNLRTSAPKPVNRVPDEIRSSPFVRNQRQTLQAMFSGVTQLKSEFLVVGTNIGNSEQLESNIGQDTEEIEYKYLWAGKGSDASFDGSYSGSVQRALAWGLTAHEGAKGWGEREYRPAEFKTLAEEAGAAGDLLGNSAALDNDSNKTLIAVRAFRGSVNAAMGQKTAHDLTKIETRLNANRPELAEAGLIGNEDETIVSVQADPAEAHPNTLPTAKVKFSGGSSLYFKGRSSMVEDALVGKAGSSARALSDFRGRKGSKVGTHNFVDFGKSHAAEDVGPSVAPTLSWNAAVDGWLAAAKTAALAFLSATNDLHASNVIEGKSGNKHIIDAEFLLDSTAFDHYEQYAQQLQVPDFEIAGKAPDWLKQYTQSHYGISRRKLASQVIEKFQKLGLDKEAQQKQVTEPLGVLLDSDALFRVSPHPFDTAFWLGSVANYHNRQPGEAEKAIQTIELIYNGLAETYQALHVDLDPGTREDVIETLARNFSAGKVPLFHLMPKTGRLVLNKELAIGDLREDRSATKLMEVARQAMTANYNAFLEDIRTEIVGARFTGLSSVLSYGADLAGYLTS
jgi:hypothetical protein